MWRRVDFVWTDVSEERIASIFRVVKSASEEPAWAGGCRLSYQLKTPSYIRTGSEGESATWEMNREERGREGSVEMGEQVAGHSRYRIVTGGTRQGYRACIDLRSLVDLVPCSGTWFPMLPTLPPFLYSYGWVFSTGSSVSSHLLTLVPRSQIFLPWRWRRYFPPKRLFTQDLHGATSQKTALFTAMNLQIP
jgi:hypothetical protein